MSILRAACAGLLALLTTGTVSPAAGIAGAADPGFAGWREVAWPLAADPFGRGRAFRCDGCGRPVTLVVRPKIGLCGCKSGIEDDDELERFSDLGEHHAYRGAGIGQPVSVGRMNGRARAFTAADGRPGSALAVAFHDRCDLIVATAWFDGGPATPELTARALRLLDSPPVAEWLAVRLGL